MNILLCIAVLLLCLCALALFGSLCLAAVYLCRQPDGPQPAPIAEQQRQKAAEVLAQWDNLMDYDGNPQPIPKAGDSR
ncbi:Uncharacterised protein [Anaerotruncus sp. 2789STDY5834896]|uniref:Uncharacterized protein n=1 Tax=uncultured Anaerotruncus sp. TaxID=905011 RepID=A0A1C6FQ49_9FIRM|nr:Uncharacterised protein [uncultured Anaerotruncus sp.]